MQTHYVSLEQRGRLEHFKSCKDTKWFIAKPSVWLIVTLSKSIAKNAANNNMKIFGNTPSLVHAEAQLLPDSRDSLEKAKLNSCT